MCETRGYLELVVHEAEKQLSEPAEGYMPEVIVQLAEKALCIAKRWNKLQRKVKYWGSILSIFSKPLACQTYDMDSGIIHFRFSFHFNSNICFIYRDLSRWFSWSCHRYSRYAHPSLRHWIWALSSGYVASFLVAYPFLGAYRVGSIHIYVLASRRFEWKLTSSLNWFIEAVVGEMLFIDLTSIFCTYSRPLAQVQGLES